MRGAAPKAANYATVQRDTTSRCRHEEEVLYPAAVLVGEYVGIKLAQTETV